VSDQVCPGRDGNCQSIWQRLRELFPRLTGRNLNDAILLAEAW